MLSFFGYKVIYYVSFKAVLVAWVQPPTLRLIVNQKNTNEMGTDFSIYSISSLHFDKLSGAEDNSGTNTRIPIDL